MSERIVRIYVENHAKSKVLDKNDVFILAPALQYPVSKGTEERGTRSYLNTQHGTFLTGFLPRLVRFCRERKIEIELSHNEKMSYTDASNEPSLKGIKLRKDQEEAVHSIVMNDRGVIVAPTGTGKTVVMGAIISCYPSARWIIISHTSALVLQTAEELKAFGFKSVGIVGAGTGKSDYWQRITVGTRQTVAKLTASKLKKFGFDGVVIDETHHVADVSGEYGYILKNLSNTCVRVGFTATVHTSQEKALAMEGLIGPVVSRLTIEQAADLNILAKPLVIIRRVPNNFTHTKIRNFREAYTKCVVENKVFHRLVLNDLKDLLSKDLSVLILVVELEHARQLITMARTLFNIDLTFVHGGTPAFEKERIRKQFTKGTIKCVVATVSWREGINIPTLGAIQTVAQGKSELKVIQEIGRGLRKIGEKEFVYIYDYFNPNNRNLIGHFGERLCLYMDRKWLAGMEP